MRHPLRAGAAAALLAFGLLAGDACHARADVIVNGGFEQGFVGWTRADSAGSDGTFNLQSGSASPVGGIPVPAPPGGTNAAMTDALGPGTHVLYQDFVVPAVLNATFASFSLFVNNQALAFFTPNPASLDFGINGFNQQARVDILLAGTDPYSVAAGDVLQNLYQTRPGDPLTSGYQTLNVNVTAVLAANVGKTLRLRFAETDNAAPLLFGVDNVSISAVPEPSPAALGVAGTLTWLVLAARRGIGRRA